MHMHVCKCVSVNVAKHHAVVAKWDFLKIGSKHEWSIAAEIVVSD